jgi:hypothetical protein
MEENIFGFVDIPYRTVDTNYVEMSSRPQICMAKFSNGQRTQHGHGHEQAGKGHNWDTIR